MRPAKWNKYEAALLIEAYFECKGKNTNEKDLILKSLSRNLRQIAINRGFNIDQKYRNLYGMKLQMSCLIGIIENKYKSWHKNETFKRVYDIYLSDKSSFYMLLHDAYNMVDGIFDFSLLEEDKPVKTEKQLIVSKKNTIKTHFINNILI